MKKILCFVALIFAHHGNVHPAINPAFKKTINDLKDQFLEQLKENKEKLKTCENSWLNNFSFNENFFNKSKDDSKVALNPETFLTLLSVISVFLSWELAYHKSYINAFSPYLIEQKDIMFKEYEEIIKKFQNTLNNNYWAQLHDVYYPQKTDLSLEEKMKRLLNLDSHNIEKSYDSNIKTMQTIGDMAKQIVTKLCKILSGEDINSKHLRTRVDNSKKIIGPLDEHICWIDEEKQTLQKWLSVLK